MSTILIAQRVVIWIDKQRSRTLDDEGRYLHFQRFEGFRKGHVFAESGPGPISSKPTQ